MSLDYKHRRSRREEGIRSLIIAFASPVSIWFFLTYIFQGQFDHLTIYIYPIVALIILCIIVFWAIPHLKSDEVFLFKLEGRKVICQCPGAKPLSYEIEVDDIEKISVSIATSKSVSSISYMVTKNGKEYEIPDRYGLSVATVVDRIRKLRPNIEREKHSHHY